jgi:hypothetical protein
MVVLYGACKFIILNQRVYSESSINNITKKKKNSYLLVNFLILKIKVHFIFSFSKKVQAGAWCWISSSWWKSVAYFISSGRVFQTIFSTQSASLNSSELASFQPAFSDAANHLLSSITTSRRKLLQSTR